MARRPSAEDDGSSMLFFLLAVLICIVLPWTMAVISALLFPGKKEAEQLFPQATEDGVKVRHCKTEAVVGKREAKLKELRSRKRLLTGGFVARTFVLLLLWLWLAYIYVQVRKVLATSALYQNFDPFSILGVSSRSSSAEIKKAFRKMSLIYHPDKIGANADDSQFIMVKKAYDALTDPVAKKNFEMYGNPDGPTRMEISVAIPSISKENQGVVLVLFVLVFILGVPLSLLWCMSGGGGAEVCGNGVRRSTMEAMAEKIKDMGDVRVVQDFVLAESGSGEVRVSDEEALSALADALGVKVANGKGAADKGSALAAKKAELLFVAHTQRRCELLTPPLAADLEQLLGRWRQTSLAMADLAARAGFGEALEAALELCRAVVQALEPKQLGSASLLQVPHFNAESLKAWRKGPRKNAGLPALLQLQGEDLHSSLNGLELSDQAVADIDDFAAVAPRVALQEMKVHVEGEDEICQGDHATLTVKFIRENLREGEAIGFAHTPLFPKVDVKEAWWLRVTMPSPKGKTARCWRITDQNREVTLEAKFKVATTGKVRLRISLLCEAYAGLDILDRELTFDSKKAPMGKGGDSSDEEGPEIYDD